MKTCFDHERLQACPTSLEFIRWSELVHARFPRTSAIASQLGRARSTFPLNLAGGKAKFTPEDKGKFIDIAHGSTVARAADLNVSFIKPILNAAELEAGKTMLAQRVGLVGGLVKSKLPDRSREDEAPYRVGGEEQE